MGLQRYFIRLSYKGTDFFGWQIQPNAISVQEALTEAFTKLNSGNPVKIVGCGRTDTGVHASDYYAHIEFSPRLELDQLAYKLNCMLPPGVAIHGIRPVSDDLHARFSATARTYHYFIHREKNPFITETSWLLKKELDLVAMNKACESLLTHTNFQCFSKVHTDVKTFDCDVTYAQWTATENGYQFTITANRFLRNMVRAIVGTLVEIGHGKQTVDDFNRILESKDRSQAGQSAPAQGLFLAKIEYGDHPDIWN